MHTIKLTLRSIFTQRQRETETETEGEKSDKIKNMYEVSWPCVAGSTLWLTYFCQFGSLSGKLLPVLQCIMLSLPLSHSLNTTAL